MNSQARTHRFRPLTRALLWYPLVAVLVAGGFAAWAWHDCGSSNGPAACRALVWSGTLWVFGAVLGLGLVLLGLTWLATLPFATGRNRGAAEGFDVPVPPAEDPTGRRNAPDPRPAPVRATRSARHRPGDEGSHAPAERH